MKQLRCAICDDQQKERDIIFTLLNQYMDLHGHVAAIDMFTSGEELLASDISVYDLIVLDIFMGEKNGIDTAHALLQRRAGAQVIFCSTSNEFAAESYEVNALRYLTKPVAKDKLFKTLDRYFEAYLALRTLTYKKDRLDESILIADILWIEADKHKCILHTAQGEQIATTTSFSQFWEQLRDCDFIKPIRYAIVPLRMIAAIPTNELKLRDGSVIAIGRDQRKAVKDAYMDYKMRSLLKRGEA